MSKEETAPEEKLIPMYTATPGGDCNHACPYFFRGVHSYTCMCKITGRRTQAETIVSQCVPWAMDFEQKAKERFPQYHQPDIVKKEDPLKAWAATVLEKVSGILDKVDALLTNLVGP